VPYLPTLLQRNRDAQAIPPFGRNLRSPNNYNPEVRKDKLDASEWGADRMDCLTYRIEQKVQSDEHVH
jgi:hypothetical protein